MTPSNDDWSKDYADFITALNSHGVEYVVIGAYALGYHGIIRATTDLDVAVKPSQENARRLVAAIKSFGKVDVDAADIAEDRLITIGHEHNSIDILTTIKGVDWSQALHSRVIARIKNRKVYVLSRECLLESKKGANRPKDQADIIGLQQVFEAEKRRKKSRNREK